MELQNPSVMQETWVRSLGWEDPWRSWECTPAFCLENPHGQRSLMGYSPWGCKELDMTEQLSTHKVFERVILNDFIVKIYYSSVPCNILSSLHMLFYFLNDSTLSILLLFCC